MDKAIITAVLLFCLSASPLLGQDWTAVQALPADTPVRVLAQGGRVDGRISVVDDTQLRLIARGKPVVIPRAAVVRVEQERRDPLWNGLLIGALASLGLRLAFGGEACSRTPDPRCTVQGLLVGAGLGAFIDHQIRRHPVIYDASQPTVMLLRWLF
jgi:hypothetical protein